MMYLVVEVVEILGHKHMYVSHYLQHIKTLTKQNKDLCIV